MKHFHIYKHIYKHHVEKPNQNSFKYRADMQVQCSYSISEHFLFVAALNPFVVTLHSNPPDDIAVPDLLISSWYDGSGDLGIRFCNSHSYYYVVYHMRKESNDPV